VALMPSASRFSSKALSAAPAARAANFTRSRVPGRHLDAGRAATVAVAAAIPGDGVRAGHLHCASGRNFDYGTRLAPGVCLGS
jgi:hypothetical protein